MRSGREPAPGFESPPDSIVYESLENALSDSPSAVIVANPTSLHAPVAIAALQAGACVLLEKPVSADLEEARGLETQVESAVGVCSMAYCFRYHPLYSALAKWVKEDRLGRIFHVHSWQASYLPDWHPWEDYRESYAARTDLGGGVVRTLDHDLDVLRWIAGQPTDVMASTASLSGIGVDVEDTADMIFRFADRKQAHVHVCFGRRDYARGMWVVGEEASATLDWARGTLVATDGKHVIDQITISDDYDLNEMYLDMLKDALDSFALAAPRSAIPLSDGIAALEMATAALESSGSSKAVHLTRVDTLKVIE